MQAAANRLAGPIRNRRRVTPGAQAHLATMDDAALLGALPIAAAVVTQGDDGAILLQAHNGRFRETVDQSTCTALKWDEAQCLRTGPIAELLTNFFAGTDV